MFYLTLYLCSKFSITIPYLLPYPFLSSQDVQKSPMRPIADNVSDQSKTNVFSTRDELSIAPRSQAAAPPAYLFILPHMLHQRGTLTLGIMVSTLFLALSWVL